MPKRLAPPCCFETTAVPIQTAAFAVKQQTMRSSERPRSVNRERSRQVFILLVGWKMAGARRGGSGGKTTAPDLTRHGRLTVGEVVGLAHLSAREPRKLR